MDFRIILFSCLEADVSLKKQGAGTTNIVECRFVQTNNCINPGKGKERGI